MAVRDERLCIWAGNSAQLTDNWGSSRFRARVLRLELSAWLVSLARYVPSKLSLNIEFALELERAGIAFLNKARVPTLVNAGWEEQLDLRDVSNKVLLALNYANDVLFATFTEREVPLDLLVVLNLVRMERNVELAEVSILFIVRILKRFFNLNSAQGAEDTFSKV